MVGVEYDGIGAEPPEVVEVVEDLLETAGAEEAFGAAGWGLGRRCPRLPAGTALMPSPR